MKVSYYLYYYICYLKKKTQIPLFFFFLSLLFHLLPHHVPSLSLSSFFLSLSLSIPLLGKRKQDQKEIWFWNFVQEEEK
jgi:hypothetical protein